jgi:hypothetical protein
MNDDVKIYGLCLERLKHQIRLAWKRAGNDRNENASQFLLESYNTGDIGDIIDILEIYDLGEHTDEALREKLDDLAYTVSILIGERLSFGITGQGHWGLYLHATSDMTLSAAG